MILVAPTEPPELRALGMTALLPEEYGADYLFPANDGLVAVQRKTMADLLASLQDGRLARELPLLHGVEYPLLLVEGRPVWTDAGLLLSHNAQFRREGWYGLCLSVQFAHNIAVVTTDDIADTIAWFKHAPSWFERPDHRGLLIRPRPTDNFGNMAPKDFAVHLLQSFPGIGPKIAEAIYNHFGRIPLRFDVDEKALRRVPGLDKRAVEMLRLLGGPIGGGPGEESDGSHPEPRRGVGNSRQRSGGGGKRRGGGRKGPRA